MIAVVLVAMSVSGAFASSIEVDAGNGQVVGQILVDHKVNQKAGVFVYALHSKEWSQWYTGPVWNPCENISLSLGAGQETGSSKTRWGASIWAGKDKVSLLCVWEDGPSGKWDRWETTYQTTDKIAVGITNRIYTRLDKGINGVVSYSAGKTGTAKLSFGKAGEVSWIVSF